MRPLLYITKATPLPGSDYHEIHAQALKLYKTLKRKTKRRPYIRSVYFKKDKVFIDYFWQHLWQKNWRDRVRRLKYYSCALELIQQSSIEPISKINPNRSSEILHRFTGATLDHRIFYVQISEDKKNGEKHFLSVFPEQ